MLTAGSSVIDLQGPLEGAGGREIISHIYISQQLLLRAENASACQGDSQPGFEEFSSFLDIGPDLAAENQKNLDSSLLGSTLTLQPQRRLNTGKRSL